MKLILTKANQKGDVMSQKDFSIDAQEEVLLVPKPRRIVINRTLPARAYGLFDSETGVQVKDFVKGNDGKIEFDNLDPNMHYDVGVIEGMDDEKPQFTINWAEYMRDETEEILKNSNDLPIKFPEVYTIRDKNSNADGIYDLVDDEDVLVAQVAKLSPQGDKPEFAMAYSFRMKDDTIK